jgi:hypothetical protein
MTQRFPVVSSFMSLCKKAVCVRHCVPPLIQSLEPRTLLSSAGALRENFGAGIPLQPLVAAQHAPMKPATKAGKATAGAKWPGDVLAGRRVTTLYVNPQGNAILKGQSFASAGDLKVYQVYFDDPGHVTVTTTGAAGVEMAFYRGSDPTPPSATSGLSNGRPKLTQRVDEKSDYYIAVRPHGALTGTFSLVVKGVAHAVVRPLNIDSHNQGKFLTDISSTFDADDYQFTTPVGGTWRISADPTGPYGDRGTLNATLLIYDQAGNPIGGSFKKPINAQSGRETEVWSGYVPAHTQVFIRIDGAGDSQGWYHVRAKLIHAGV